MCYRRTLRHNAAIQKKLESLIVGVHHTDFDEIAIFLQLRASYSRKTPALQRSVVAASPALSLSGMTPAIFHGHVQNSKISDNQPTLEENSIRKEALQAFKRAGVKQDTQLADKGITDNLLNF